MISQLNLVKTLRNKFEDPNPILIRELRSLFRMSRFIMLFSFATAMIGLGTIVGANIFLTTNTLSSEIGKHLFEGFLTVLLMVTAFVAPIHASTSLTSEKESKTYETMILSGLTAQKIVLGKYMTTIASIGLVIVAVFPSIGISFLFGGVSPLEVFLGLLMIMSIVAPLAAFGIATSARVKTTRVSIFLTWIGCGMFGMPYIGFQIALLSAINPTSYSYGPFEGIRYIADHINDISVLVPAVITPLGVSIMVTWFLLCTAISSTQSYLEDRIRSFKYWALCVVMTSLVTISSILLSNTSFDKDESAALIGMVTIFINGIFMFIFIDDSPLPVYEKEGNKSYIKKLFGRFLKSGILSTSRFGLLVVIMISLGSALLYESWLFFAQPITHRTFTTTYHYALACALFTLGLIIMYSFFINLGALIRSSISNGNIVRVLVFLIGFMMVVIPVVITIFIDISMHREPLGHVSEDLPIGLIITPIGYLIGTIVFLDKHSEKSIYFIIGNLCLYGVGLIILLSMLQIRIRHIQQASLQSREAILKMIETRRSSRALMNEDG